METLATTKSQSWLIWFLRGFLVLGFFLLFGRILDLQIIKGNYFRGLSEENRIRRVQITAPRGRVFARGGEILVGNKEVKKKLVFDPKEGYLKVPTDLADNETVSEWVREYPLGKAFGHVSGYIGEVNGDELGKVRGQCPDKGPRKLGGNVGRSGLELQYECMLAGVDGEILLEVDASGKKIRVLGRKDPIPGADLKTTIDYGLQKKANETLADRKGAVIIADRNAEILAMVSGPGYDPNVLIDPAKKEERSKMLENKDLPLFNRVMGGTFHPGSVFKPFVGIAALEENAIDRNYHYTDTGQIVTESIYGNFSYKNWYFTQYGGAEGSIDIRRALARSTDTFFYKIGELTGMEKLDKWIRNFGLSEKTGIDLPGEISGLVPNPEWKLREKGERWFLGNTYHYSIGQGDLALTPLEVEKAVISLANGGRLCTPRIAQNETGEECRDLNIKNENLEIIKEGMKQACSAGGTAYTFFGFAEKTGFPIYCKTGTAQDERGEPHAWFIAYSQPPGDSGNDLVLTALLEHGGEGSKVAGPLATEIFSYWYKVPVTPTPSISPLPLDD